MSDDLYYPLDYHLCDLKVKGAASDPWYWKRRERFSRDFPCSSAEEVVSDAAPVVVESGRPGAVLTSRSVCSRTPAVRDLIVAAVTGVTDCANVTRSHLRVITTLTFSPNTLSTSGLRAWDFEGLSGLGTLEMLVNGLTALPAGVFDDLTTLATLSLTGNALTALPEGVFEKLTALTTLQMVGNPGLATFLPVANAGADVTARTGTTVTLSGSATGPWGNNVTWAWKQVTSTGADVAAADRLTLTGNTTATPSFTAPSTGGDLYFKLTVTGKASTATGTDTVKVSVSSLATTAPSVTGVTILPEFGNGSWGEGETVEAALTFDEAVTVDTTGGTPTVALTLGTSTAKTAAYVRGSGTTELVFGYTLAKDEEPYDSVLLTLNSLTLNGGAIRSSESGADAALAHDGFAVIGGPTLSNGFQY